MFRGAALREARLLTWTSDQGLFAAQMYLCVALGYRLLFFPDVNHQAHNIDKSVLKACGIGHLDGKTMFLARFRHGPFSQGEGGHWQGQL